MRYSKRIERTQQRGSTVTDWLAIMVLKILSLVVGTTLLLVGIIGLFVPIMPQTILVLPGLALIGYASPKMRTALQPLVRRSEQAVRRFVKHLWQRIRPR